MKFLVMLLVVLSVSCGIVPDDERYVTDESIRSDDNSTASLTYPPPRGR